MSNSKLLVFMMTFNNGSTLQATLDDLASQTFSDFELFIFDDCSSDNTRDILSANECRFENVKIVFNTNNLGVLKNLRNSLRDIEFQISKSKFFHWGCPDDRYGPNYFERLIDVLESDTEISAVQSLVKVHFVADSTEKIAKCSSLAMNDDSSVLFRDYLNGVYQPYNQFIHGISRSKIVPMIYQINGPYWLYKAVVMNELFIVALFKLMGKLAVVDQVIHTKNITESFEKRYPTDPFTISRSSLLKAFLNCLMLSLYVKENFIFIFRKQFYISLISSFRLYFVSKLKSKIGRAFCK
ncbi:Spore coat polysaccharide biosynthesis protein SpsA [compost metagenome]